MKYVNRIEEQARITKILSSGKAAFQNVFLADDIVSMLK